MKNRRAFLLALLLILCQVVLAAPLVSDSTLAGDSTRYVTTTGTDNNDCGDPSEPCRTVQYAVDVSSDGDVIKIANGTYTGVGSHPSPSGYNGPAMITQVVYIDKTVTVRGGYSTAFSEPPDPDANLTTLDAEGKGRVLFIAGEISPTIEGLSLTGGNADGLAGWGQSWDGGGGVYILTAGATLRNNVVFGNVALGGGGLYLVYSDATLDGNTVTTNTANWSGGGLYFVYSDAMLTGNTIHDNDAGEFDGGGLVLSHSPVTLSNNTVSANSANNGAGLYLSSSDAIVNGNTIQGNTAVDGGGGLLLYGSDALLSGNTIEGNTAGGYWGSGGGGLFLRSGAPVLANNVFAGNHAEVSGSALYIRSSSPNLLHNTIADNTGGDGTGVYVTDDGTTYGSATLTNTILVNHSVGIKVTGGSLATLKTTLWNGNATDRAGTGVINHTSDRTGSPKFVDPSTGDYHVGASSAAIDAGVDAGVTEDIDGDVRPQGSGYDIGADELAAPTAVELAHFTARPEGGTMLLAWQTVSEVDAAGFNLCRVKVRESVMLRLNDALIPSLGHGSLAGASYEFTNNTAVPGVTYLYWLEIVDSHGRAIRHGPVLATRPGSRLYLPLVWWNGS